MRDEFDKFMFSFLHEKNIRGRVYYLGQFRLQIAQHVETRDSRDEGESGAVVASVGACNEIQITPLVSIYHRNDASARRYSAGRLVHKLM